MEVATGPTVSSNPGTEAATSNESRGSASREECAYCGGPLSDYPLRMCNNPVLHSRQHCHHTLTLKITTIDNDYRSVSLRCRFDAPHPGQMHWDGEYEWAQ